MSRSAVLLALAVLAAVALGALVAVLTREPEKPAPAPVHAATPAVTKHAAPVEDVAADEEAAAEPEAATPDAAAPAAGSTVVVGAGDAAAAADTRPVEQIEAELGLPPLDTRELPDEEECKALATDQRRFQTAENMIVALPEKNLNSVGAQRLRAMHARLDREIARRSALIEKRGIHCPD